MSEVLVVDDDVCHHRLMERLLATRGHRAACAVSSEEALDAVRRQRPELVLLDLDLGASSGLDLLGPLGREAPGVPVIFVSGQSSVESAVRAIKWGAVDFVVKPFDNDRLLDAVDELVKGHPAPSESIALGRSPRFLAALALARRFAVPAVNVLLVGETGTGKEVLARYIHAASPRAQQPFVPVDCSVLSESLLESELFGHEKGAFTGATGTRIGHFEKAQGGTIFLDEIGNLPLSIQAKLLRVLQERTFSRVGGSGIIHLDVRVVSATNADLGGAIAAGRFREDLYYRLNGMTIALPSLRDRPGDVENLARHFVESFATELGVPEPKLSPEALDALEERTWPGNVRELKNVIRAAVVLASRGVIEPADLLPPLAMSRSPSSRRPPPALETCSPLETSSGLEVERVRLEDVDLKAVANEAAERAERAVLAALIQRTHQRCTELARAIRVDPKTLRAKLRKYGLEYEGL